MAAHCFSEETGSNAGHQSLFYTGYVTSRAFVVIPNDHKLQMNPDPDDAPNPDREQEGKSSYGRDRGKSTLICKQ